MTDAIVVCPCAGFELYEPIGCCVCGCEKDAHDAAGCRAKVDVSGLSPRALQRWRVGGYRLDVASDHRPFPVGSKHDDNQVPATDAPRPTPNSDGTDMRDLGVHGLADRMGLEYLRSAAAHGDPLGLGLDPWPPDGGNIQSFISWTVKSVNRMIDVIERQEAELQRLLRLMGDEQALAVDYGHGQTIPSTSGRPAATDRSNAEEPAG